MSKRLTVMTRNSRVRCKTWRWTLPVETNTGRVEDDGPYQCSGNGGWVSLLQVGMTIALELSLRP